MFVLGARAGELLELVLNCKSAMRTVGLSENFTAWCRLHVQVDHVCGGFTRATPSWGPSTPSALLVCGSSPNSVVESPPVDDMIL